MKPTHAQLVKQQTQDFVDAERRRTNEDVPFSRVIKWLDDNRANYHSGLFREFCQANITGITYKEQS